MSPRMARLRSLGIRISEAVSAFVGTWTFVFLYTTSMVLWVWLHLHGYLHIDSPDFMKWNLWLSYFAGTQASIVLMSQARQAERDRQKQDSDLHISKESYKKIEFLITHIRYLEDILDSVINEKIGKK